MQENVPAAVVLGAREDGRVHLVVNIDRSLEERGLDAVKVVREAAALVGGGGGGRPTMARAGGRDPEQPAGGARRRRAGDPGRARVTRKIVLVLAGLALAAMLAPVADAGSRAKRWNTRAVGHYDPRGGFNGDIWVHETTAYLGSWGITGRCPAFGVRAISVARPARPRLVSRFARFRGSSAEDVWVGAVTTPTFTGDLAAVGLQRCRGNGIAGLALYDVEPGEPAAPLDARERRRHPRRPRALDRPAGGRTGARAAGRAAVALHVDEPEGDVRIVDVTNPRAPLELADWDYRRDGPNGERQALTAIRGASEVLVHSVWPYAGGTKAFVSHWDAGEVFLDLDRPRRPAVRQSHAVPGAGVRERPLRVVHAGRAVLRPERRGGRLLPPGHRARRLGLPAGLRPRRPGQPAAIARFATENSIRGRDGRLGRDGFYSVHNNVFVGHVEVVSWYADGVRIVSFANPRRPREIGYFVPPPKRDPQRMWTAPNGNRAFPNVWGVFPYRGLVYASDIHSGLWVIRARGIPWSAATTP